jgi:hypothetical protein
VLLVLPLVLLAVADTVEAVVGCRCWRIEGPVSDGRGRRLGEDV